MPQQHRAQKVSAVISDTPAYTGTAARRIRRARNCSALVIAMLGMALPVGGCSTSYQLGALFGDDRKAAEPVAYSGNANALPRPFRELDLSVAKTAAVELLARGEKDGSQPWENPRTGARGTITTLNAAYDNEGTQCRDFLASYVDAGRESWFQGGACKSGERWQVRDVRPLHRT
jgi:17 kDa outer membrane surface antigen